MSAPIVSFPNGNPNDRLVKIQGAIIEGSLEAMHEVCAQAKRGSQQVLTDTGKVDQGLARGSIDYKVELANGVITGTVFCGAGHGKWIEFGRRGVYGSPAGVGKDSASAAWPPVKAIRAWVVRNVAKLGVLGTTKGGRARKLSGKNTRQQKLIDRATFLIGRKIYQRGIKPNPFMIPVFLIWSKRLQFVVNKRVQERKANL